MSEIEDLEMSIAQDEAYIEYRTKEINEAYFYVENLMAKKRAELIDKNSRALAALEKDNKITIGVAIQNNKCGMRELREIESEILKKRALLEKLKGKTDEK